MNTDKLFQEYFQIVPQALLELLQITPPCTYRYESPVVKSSERRMDGFLEPEVVGCPYYFVEIQGYLDPLIYWRGLHHVTRYHETRSDLDRKNWKLVILFLDQSYDPGISTLGPLENGAEHWLISGILSDLLRTQSVVSPWLNVLLPLVAADVSEIQQLGAEWARSIQNAPKLGKRQRGNLIDLLIKFVMQRFVELPYKEIENMLKLTPIEETRAGKELIQLGIVQGREVGREEGREEGLEIGREEGLRAGIQAVLSIRFQPISTERMEQLLKLLIQIHDDETVAMLLGLSQKVESLELFEQKVAELIARR